MGIIITIVGIIITRISGGTKIIVSITGVIVVQILGTDSNIERTKGLARGTGIGTKEGSREWHIGEGLGEILVSSGITGKVVGEVMPLREW